MVGAAAGVEYSTWGLSGALLHTATGLFIQADYIDKERSANTVTRDANRWNIQGGVQRNFFGIGNTSMYAEYGSGSGWLEVNGLRSDGGNADGHLVGVDSKYKVWGLGVVQNIDAAAMELYAGYRAFDFKETGAAAGNLIGSGDVRVFSVGSRIKF